MPAAPATAALSRDTAPPAGPAGDRTPAQHRADRVLSLLRKLIAYGQDLARAVQGRATAETLFTVAVHFGTRDMALILARITRGLRLAAALEAKLISRSVRPDAPPSRVRAGDDHAVSASADIHASGDPTIHAPPDPAKRPARRSAPRPSLPEVPTAEEIAAALRHRSAAAVIADICRDLGIVPANPLWREVMTVLCERGGNVMKFFKDAMARLFGALAAPPSDDADPWLVPPPHCAAACGTGPP